MNEFRGGFNCASPASSSIHYSCVGYSTAFQLMKPILRRAYAVLISSKANLQSQLEVLKKENSQLQAKVAALQKAKIAAENQAEELRKDKERLRAKIATQKKASEQAERVTEQLRAKHESLQEEHAQLQKKVKFPRK